MSQGAITDLERNAPDPTPDPKQIFSAIVQSDAAADGDSILVELVLQPGVKQGPAIGWQPRPNNQYPSIGDLCAVTVADDQSWWVVGWWPYA